MLSRSLLRVARQVAAPRARTTLRGPPMVFFSTQDWVLGKGKAKTSTGLVSCPLLDVFASTSAL